MILAYPYIVMFSAAVFALALGMNLVRKNTTLVAIYFLQSCIVGVAIMALGREGGTPGLYLAGALTLAIKAAMAPWFLFWLIRRYSAHFSAATYLGLPLSLLALAAITGFSYSISNNVPLFASVQSVPLLIASIFIAFFLMVNRRGALSAVIGILALENGIVFLTTILGLEHSVGLEIAIAFDIAVWVAIATAFLSLLNREFGTLDAHSHSMTRLTEE